MHRFRLLSALLLFPLFLVAGGNAQSPAIAREKPVWTLEVLQVKPGAFGGTMGYLDDHWMLVREEAKRRGLVVSYHRIAQANFASNDSPTIVLLTEFKNQSACDSRDALFRTIESGLPKTTPGVFPRSESKDLYNLVSEGVFRDYSDSPATHLELLAHE